MRRHWLPCTAVALVLLLALTGCGSRKLSSTSVAPSEGQGVAADYEPGRTKQETDFTTDAPEDHLEAAVAAERKQIYHAEAELRVSDAEEALTRLTEAVKTAGGYVQETSQSGTRESGLQIRVVLRVPADQFRSVVDLLPTVGEVRHRREWTQDVTEEYVDLEARIAAKETHLEQLRKLYERSGTVQELMELEKEIARVTGELESLKGRYRALSSQVALSTITVTLTEISTGSPPPAPRNLWERMRRGFVTSWNGVINSMADLVVLLVMLVPLLLWVVILAPIGFVLYRLIRRRRRPPADPQPQ